MRALQISHGTGPRLAPYTPPRFCNISSRIYPEIACILLILSSYRTSALLKGPTGPIRAAPLRLQGRKGPGLGFKARCPGLSQWSCSAESSGTHELYRDQYRLCTLMAVEVHCSTFASAIGHLMTKNCAKVSRKTEKRRFACCVKCLTDSLVLDVGLASFGDRLADRSN